MTMLFRASSRHGSHQITARARCSAGVRLASRSLRLARALLALSPYAKAGHISKQLNRK